MQNTQRTHQFIYFKSENLPQLKKQFQSNLFQSDRIQINRDIDKVKNGELPPTIFSWWCVNLHDAVRAGQFQVAQESLLASWHLLDDQSAPQLARELLITQSKLPIWRDKEYGAKIGHDLSSSHHCRALSAGLETAKEICKSKEIEEILESYIQKVRAPYLEATFQGNDYLVGYRNTNWLSHLSGSVLIAEIAWAKYGLEDRSTIALAKANVLRYIDAIRPDGSIPEIGDYFHYGMEFALLSLHAWSLHYENNILGKYSQAGLSQALPFILAFTDNNGDFWADFGDTHIGKHEASRVVGYLYAHYFESEAGQWLGDLAVTREPLAGLLRPPKIVPKFAPQKFTRFTSEEMFVVNWENRHLAFRGGPCRSKNFNIPHRHYDSGSLIYRFNGINVLADSGHDHYTDDYWKDFDSPQHVRSAAYLHNVILVDNRGHQKEDATNGQIILVNDKQPGFISIVWNLTSQFPMLKSWERQILLFEEGILIIVDCLIPNGAQNLSVLWHMHEKPELQNNNWTTSFLCASAIANHPLRINTNHEFHKPRISLEAELDRKINKKIIIVSCFADQKFGTLLLKEDFQNHFITFGQYRWNFKNYYLDVI